MESGVPISEFRTSCYLNAGEIPTGGRGKLQNLSSKLDLHADYPFRLSEKLLTVVSDFFNVTNNQTLRLPDQNRQTTVGQNNVDFLCRCPITFRSTYDPV
jgi:hypothetical protein